MTAAKKLRSLQLALYRPSRNAFITVSRLITLAIRMRTKLREIKALRIEVDILTYCVFERVPSDNLTIPSLAHPHRSVGVDFGRLVARLGAFTIA
jgi:hypothetical protein